MVKPLVTNAADPDQVKRAAHRERYEVSQDVKDLRFVLDSREGRRFLWRLLAVCGIDELGKDPSGSETYFNLGRRNVGLRLKADMIAASEESWLLMQQEQFNEARKDA